MLKKTITYTDYNGIEREEDFYFNLSKAELMEMELSTAGGFENRINKIIGSKDAPLIMATFKDILLKAYGEKSDDGTKFRKSEEISKDFAQSEAYSVLFMELLTNTEAAAEFMSKILPQDLVQQTVIPTDRK